MDMAFRKILPAIAQDSNRKTINFSIKERRRNPNWTQQEIATLAEDFQKRRSILYGKYSMGVTQQMKHSAWRDLTHTLNTKNKFCKRTVKEVQKKWQNTTWKMKRQYDCLPPEGSREPTSSLNQFYIPQPVAIQPLQDEAHTNTETSFAENAQLPDMALIKNEPKEAGEVFDYEEYLDTADASHETSNDAYRYGIPLRDNQSVSDAYSDTNSPAPLSFTQQKNRQSLDSEDSHYLQMEVLRAKKEKLEIEKEKLLIDKDSAAIKKETLLLEKENVALEKIKLQIETEKLHLEKEKLVLEKQFYERKLGLVENNDSVHLQHLS